MKKRTISILIPVYNEKETIENVVKKVHEVKLQNWEKEIIVIDDASIDGTRDILKKFEPEEDITIIYGEKNLGKGGALKCGLSFANGDWMLFQDADMEYDPQDYSSLLSPIEKGNAEVVFGSRFLKKNKKNSFVYAFGDFLATFIFNMTHKTKLTDLATCYKVFPKRIVPDLLKTEENDFVFDVVRVSEVIAKENIPIKEVPISYFPRWYQKGKKLTFSHGMKILREIMKTFLHGKRK